MLLPEVARKKIGNIQQWEDMLASARAGLKIMSGLLDYCIHDAPQHLRPAIFTALSGVSLAGADYDAYGMYYFFEKRVCGTWLESIANNPQFIISFFKDDYQPQALHKALFPNSRWKGDLEQLEFSQAHEIFQNWLDAMVKVPIEEIGASQFNIHSLKQFSMPEIVFSEGFKPEPVILHLLKGFESFSLPDKGGAQRDTRLDEWANESCVYVVKTLASRFELDCKAFADLGSNSIRILAEAGLDKRHLPRMNARDRGLLVSQELGL
jgi:hypothetical protein